MEINGTKCHETLRRTTKPLLAFQKGCDFDAWRGALKEKFMELTGLNVIAENACAPSLTIESDERKQGYRQIRLVFYSEVDEAVPCYLLIPDTGKETYPYRRDQIRKGRKLSAPRLLWPAGRGSRIHLTLYRTARHG